jgi:hypothetical protein
MRRIFLLGAAIFVFNLAVAQTSKPVPAFDQQLIEQQKRFLEASRLKNATVIDRAVADDFQGIETNGDLYDKDELVESAQDVPKGARSYDFRVVKLTNDSAVVAYNLIVPGEHPRYRHMADTWAKVDGRWQLKFRQITPNLWSANDLE